MAVGGFIVAQASGAGQTVSLIVSGSLLAIVLWSNAVGAMLPLAARAVGIDPAPISGPLMSTVVDTTGLLIYFAIARMTLR